MNTNKVRLVRVDKHNIAVQRLVEVEVVKEIDGKRTKTGETRQEWEDSAYFGRLDQAARCAVTEAMPFDAPISPVCVSQAVEAIIAETKAVVS